MNQNWFSWVGACRACRDLSPGATPVPILFIFEKTWWTRFWEIFDKYSSNSYLSCVYTVNKYKSCSSSFRRCYLIFWDLMSWDMSGVTRSLAWCYYHSNFVVHFWENLVNMILRFCWQMWYRFIFTMYIQYEHINIMFVTLSQMLFTILSFHELGHVGRAEISLLNNVIQ